MRLTDLSIKALKAPASNFVIFPDDMLTGFGVRITANGVRSFVLTHGVRRQRETIGRVGIISLAEARAEAKRILAEYTLGKQKTAAVAWDTAVAQYLSIIAQRLKPRTHADYKRILSRHFRFGGTKVCDLSSIDIHRKLDRLAHIPAEQQHAFVVVRAFVRWAYKRNYLDRNPMERMEQPKGYKARDRVLDDSELVKVWRASSDNTYGRIVKLLILTGQRENEITNLVPGMLDGDLVNLPSWLTKNSIAHTFPVGSISASLFVGSSVEPDPTALLFPARGRVDKPFNGWGNSKAALDKASGVTGWRLHDLRRTFRTKWEELGISPAVSERYINHISGVHSGVQGIYNRHKYLAEMREAVKMWEAHLQLLLAT